ncbi:TetR/AcrR family transcriptional regulator [Bacillus salitolerans]|uniref:TetR/AcrR family transcriptional regulator n=1 Tax=Bacillus salitolerans TaxID=1437434 RepID=A0ABW4LU44_9BACI
MVRGFSEKEREMIKQNLIDEGKLLFDQYGLKKTSVSQITNKVGIAQGSFYLFYSSKEELYFDIVEQEEHAIKELLMEDLLDPAINSEKFTIILIRSLKLIDENPILRRLFLEKEFEQMVRKLPAEKVEQHIQNDGFLLTPLIEKWQSEGRVIKQDPHVIGAMFRAFILLALHKKEIGEEIFDETISLIAESLANRVFKE